MVMTTAKARMGLERVTLCCFDLPTRTCFGLLVKEKGSASPSLSTMARRSPQLVKYQTTALR